MFSRFRIFLEKNQLINTKRDISLRDIFADKSKDEKYNLPRIWDAQRKLTPSKK
ncbi:C69 family dipeptidase [Enterococcus faecium]